MPEGEYRVTVQIAGLDKLAEQIAAQVQKAVAMIRTPSMKVGAIAGTSAGGAQQGSFMQRMGDTINRLSSVISGLGARVFRERLRERQVGAG